MFFQSWFFCGRFRTFYVFLCLSLCFLIRTDTWAKTLIKKRPSHHPKVLPHKELPKKPIEDSNHQKQLYAPPSAQPSISLFSSLDDPNYPIQPPAASIRSPLTQQQNTSAIANQVLPEAKPIEFVIGPNTNKAILDANDVPHMAARTTWSPGSNQWGAKGLLRLDSAYAARTGSIAFYLSADLAIFSPHWPPSQLLVGQKKKEIYNTNTLGIIWTFIKDWELGFNLNLINSMYNSTLNIETNQSLGGPQFILKYSHTILPNIGLGAKLTFAFANTINNKNISNAWLLSGQFLSSYQPWKHLVFTINLGGTYDRSDTLNTPNNTSNSEQFAFHYNKYPSIPYGLGAQGYLSAEILGFSPYVELTGKILLNQPPPGADPLLFTTGLKIYIEPSNMVEWHIAGDIRLLGAPQNNEHFAGIAPWTIYSMLSIHLFDHDPLRKEIIKEVFIKEKTFTITGKVLDSSTGEYIPESMLSIEGYEATPIVPDKTTGLFHSFALPQNSNHLTITAIATGYQNLIYTINPQNFDSNVQLVLSLEARTAKQEGTLKGVIKDNHTGQPLSHAKILIPSMKNLIIHTDKQGFFLQENIPKGFHHLLISASGYITQRKKIYMHIADIIILNIDLTKNR